jgi:excisionase family DNA binding protein
MKSTLAEIDLEAGGTVAVPVLIDADQLAELMRVSLRHFYRLVHEGEFPEGILIGHSRRWSASQYAAWVEERRNKQAKRRR